MTYKSLRRTAKRIGDDSYSLINFMGMPSTATPEDMISALQRDVEWQQDHCNDIAREIDRELIKPLMEMCNQ